MKVIEKLPKRMVRFLKRIYHGVRNRVNRMISGRREKRNTDICQLMKKVMTKECSYVESDEVIDVIVPIYNGYDYLVRLFPTLNKTDLKSQIYLVDDCSTDERVIQLEKEFVQQTPNAVLMKNKENYGFVKSVNCALLNSKNHVALVNTDTELPNHWLERLMAPILNDKKVGSSTPYTNSGTIFSFPNFCYNNSIYRGMSVEQIDEIFQYICPRYSKAPTGVGFCMGMNKEAIRQVGGLDYETFSKGFGEENDWCQRAIRKGFSNVQVENLFVYHKHGGSFASEEKERLIRHNLAIVNKRYPNYERDVRRFIERDPNREIRQLAQMLLDMNCPQTKSILYFDHSLGGGATAYLDRQIKEQLQEGNACSVIRYHITEQRYGLEFYCGELKKQYTFASLEEFNQIQNWLHFDEVVVNEVVTYPNIQKVLDWIYEFAEVQKAKLVFLFHDYFAVCPTINLVNERGVYCDLPMGKSCEECFKSHHLDQIFLYHDVKQWQHMWQAFLEKCDEVRTFSEDTRKRVEGIFGKSVKYTMIPHKVEYLFPVHKTKKTTDTWNIGILGVLSDHKGGKVVKEMLEQLKHDNPYQMKIKLIGEAEDNTLIAYDDFEQTGRYRTGELPRLILEQDIDIIFIPSIWPETFSYTTEEAMQMGLPVACFELGAPADRVREYDSGMIISQMDAGQALKQFADFFRSLSYPETSIDKEVVYITEYASFSSRYRLEHLYEEMLAKGIKGKIWTIEEMPSKMDWDKVKSIVIYRCKDVEPIHGLMMEAEKRKIPVFYSVDDLIFDYDIIKNFDFFDKNVYHDLEEYARKVSALIERCSATIVSTDMLAKCVKEKFPETKVLVDRNVASMEMWVLSNIARLQKEKHTDKVVLGYFSGSQTHNADFALISDAVYEVMKNHAHVELLVVGVLDLNEKFNRFDNRIRRVGFVDWKELPSLLASVDINLMPLENTMFHWCKSENKWMEAAMVGVPTIGSFNPEIGTNTSDEKDIVLCHDAEEWLSKLEALVQDKDKREGIGAQALQRVWEEKTTWKGHDAICDALME